MYIIVDLEEVRIINKDDYPKIDPEKDKLLITILINKTLKTLNITLTDIKEQKLILSVDFSLITRHIIYFAVSKANEKID
jgi:hypothetical protein